MQLMSIHRGRGPQAGFEMAGGPIISPHLSSSVPDCKGSWPYMSGSGKIRAINENQEREC